MTDTPSQDQGISMSVRMLLAEAENMGWQSEIISARTGLVRYTLPDGRKLLMKNVRSEKVDIVHTMLSNDKEAFAEMAKLEKLAVPDTKVYEDSTSAELFMSKYNRIVVKPRGGSHGDGITINVSTPAQLHAAVEAAMKVSERVLMQQQVAGDDYRLLYIGAIFVAAVRREPATVIGDGISSIRQLIDKENTNPDRGEGYTNKLCYIPMSAAERFMGESIDDVPTAGSVVQVVGTANMGTGGKFVDVTDDIDPRVHQLGDEVVEKMGFNFCGIDIMYAAGGEPYLIEVNSAPSLILHERPYQGEARNTPRKLLEWVALTKD